MYYSSWRQCVFLDNCACVCDWLVLADLKCLNIRARLCSSVFFKLIPCMFVDDVLCPI